MLPVLAVDLTHLKSKGRPLDHGRASEPLRWHGQAGGGSTGETKTRCSRCIEATVSGSHSHAKVDGYDTGRYDAGGRQA